VENQEKTNARKEKRKKEEEINTIPDYFCA